MRCGGLGHCRCGEPACAGAEWSFWFGMMWRLIGWEMQEQDDAIRYYTQLIET